MDSRPISHTEAWIGSTQSCVSPSEEHQSNSLVFACIQARATQWLPVPLQLVKNDELPRLSEQLFNAIALPLGRQHDNFRWRTNSNERNVASLLPKLGPAGTGAQ